MRSLLLTVLVLQLTLTACISISTPTPIDATPLFVTATLPATDTPKASPTAITTPTPTLSLTAAPNCKDAAILVKDVNFPDGTNVPYDTRFTKTWEFLNSGTCPWSGYTIAYVSGDRMGAPDSAQVPQTSPKAHVDVSVDLTSPTSDGAYAGFFELHNSNGAVLPIGIEKNFWVKITVGTVTSPTNSASTSAIPPTVGAKGTPGASATCKHTTSSSYENQIANLINNARKADGMAGLGINSQLAEAALGHSIDMACTNSLSHIGSNGSTYDQRVAAAGYGGTFRGEIIYADGTAQDAFNWWMNDPPHYDLIMDSGTTEMGVGHANVPGSVYGDWFTVDFGR